MGDIKRITFGFIYYHHKKLLVAPVYACLTPGCLDAWLSGVGADWLIHNDGVHAHQVGNLVLGHRVFEAIAQYCSGLTNYVFEQERNTEWTRMTTPKRAGAGDPFKTTW